MQLQVRSEEAILLNGALRVAGGTTPPWVPDVGQECDCDKDRRVGPPDCKCKWTVETVLFDRSL